MLALDRLTALGGAAYPHVAVAPSELARVAGDRLDVVEAEVVVADLYLALALELGDPAALAEFERTLVPGMRAALGRACRSSDVIDEVVQRVRVRVLVGEAARPPKIASYTGRGKLYAWLRVTALRALSNFARGSERDPAKPATDAVGSVGAIGAIADSLAWPSPERLLLDERFGDTLRAALGHGLAALPPRERTLLRLHYLDGITLDKIATIYAVNKSTVSRWLGAAREGLLQCALHALRAEVPAGADTEELESLCTYICGRLELSLSRLLESRA